METVDIKELDTRYEGLRIKDKRRERIIRLSIMEKGVLEPVYVIKDSQNNLILLDGHKRFRGAIKSNIHQLPVMILEHSEVPGILKFLRMSNNKGLTQIEQASLVNELYQHHGMSPRDIALHLEKSPAWVSLRIGIWKDMSGSIREKIMAGHFPLHNYMYTLKRFKRLKTTGKEDIDTFVNIVSNKGLSTRDIDMLAQGYFKGSNTLKEQLQQGNIDWMLQQLKQQAKEKELPLDGLTELEAKTLSHLNWTFVCITRLTHMLHDNRFENKAFFVKGEQIVKKILGVKDGFLSSLEGFYDRAG